MDFSSKSPKSFQRSLKFEFKTQNGFFYINSSRTYPLPNALNLQKEFYLNKKKVKKNSLKIHTAWQILLRKRTFLFI